MKIAFLIQDITTAGGTERTTCCLAEQMACLGWQVSIVSVFKNYEQPAYSAGSHVKIHYITNQRYDDTESYLRRLIRCLALRDDVKKDSVLSGADVIICQKIFASLLAVSSGMRTKAVACEHFRYKMYNSVVRYLRNKMYNRMKALVVLTEADKKQFENHNVKHVVCIPNMVSVQPLEYKGINSKTIVSVGRLTKQKGYDMLVRAVSLIAGQMGDYRIDVYGEGEMHQELDNLRCQLNVEKQIRFCGYSSNIAEIYSNSLFYVMSSRFEGFPMVLLEAAACNLPIVSFNCPEGPGILLKNGGGIIVDNGDINALAEAILRMIQNTELRETYRTQTVSIVQPYSPQSITMLWRTFLLT